MRKRFFTLVLLMTAIVSFSFAQNGSGKSGNRTLGVDIPTVETTCPIINITSTSATGIGNIVSIGGSTVFERGFCWNTTRGPLAREQKVAGDDETVEGGISTSNFDIGPFTRNLVGDFQIKAKTTYYVRAYAKNAVGIGYGDECEFTTLSALPPTKPILESPVDASTKIDISTLLKWKTSKDAETYTIEWDTVSTFNSTAKVSNTTSNATTLSITVSALKYTTKYYWHVKAQSASGTSEWSDTWSFTTKDEPLAAPILVNPANASIDASLTPTLIWAQNTRATSYRYELATSNTFVAPLVASGTTTSISYVVTTPLTLGTTYYWRVKAYSATDESVWSTVWSFTTKTVPSVPVLSSPADAATCVGQNATIQWNQADNTSKYIYELATTNPPVAPFFVNGETVDLNVALTGLAAKTTYYWHVKAVKNNDTSVWSNIFSFTTKGEVPALPVLTLPANNATNVIDTPVLTWNPSANATNYIYELSEDNTFATTSFSGTTAQTSVTTTTLTPSSVLYWRVKAYNDCDTSDWSTVNTFTVGTTSVENEILANLVVKPNPTSDYVEISGLNANKVSFELFNSVGELVNINASNSRIDLSNLSSGVYNLVIIADGVKIVKAISVIK